MKQIKDVVEEWPPSGWGRFYSVGNRLSPDLKTSIIKGISIIKGDIHLSVISNGKEFSAPLNVLDTTDTNRIVEVLSSAVGTLLDDAGKLEI